MLLLHRVEQLEPVEPAALQPDVEEHQVRAPRRDRGQRVVRIARGARQIAFVLQDAGDQLPDVGFVVNDEDVGDHGYAHGLVASCWVFGSAAGLRRHCLGRKSQSYPRSSLARHLGRGVVQFDPPAVLLGDAADDGEAEAGALLACRHIGFEQPAAALLRQPDAVVDHVDDDVGALAERRHVDMALARARPAARRRPPRSRS